jgi:hypothetical protein
VGIIFRLERLPSLNVYFIVILLFHRQRLFSLFIVLCSSSCSLGPLFCILLLHDLSHNLVAHCHGMTRVSSGKVSALQQTAGLHIPSRPEHKLHFFCATVFITMTTRTRVQEMAGTPGVCRQHGCTRRLSREAGSEPADSHSARLLCSRRSKLRSHQRWFTISVSFRRPRNFWKFTPISGKNTCTRASQHG